MARRSKKSKKIILYVILSCLIIGITEIFFNLNYTIKTIIKLFLFLVVPILISKKRDKKQLKKMLKPTKLLFKSILLGVTLLIIMLFIYFLFSETYNFNIIKQIIKPYELSENNFWFICLYVSVINSLLEEFIFRGYSFLLLKKLIKKIYAYLFSSITFALYHIPMIYSLFEIPTLIIITFVQILIGMILNFIDDKQENIYNSWMSHMFINFGINTIGLMLLGIL